MINFLCHLLLKNIKKLYINHTLTTTEIMTKKMYILLICVISIFNSCEVHEVEPSLIDTGDPVLSAEKSQHFQRGKVVSYEEVLYLTQEQVQSLGNGGPATGFESLLNFGVTIYKITYITRYKNSLIQATGAVGIPHMQNPKGRVIFNHGTMFSNADIPPSTGMELGTLLTTANGYITFAADYIGLGGTTDRPQAYLINEEAVNTVVDLALAGNKLLKDELFHGKIPKKLFMYGYSQGGIVTMGVQRAIETHPFYRKRLKLTAVSSGAGPYALLAHTFIPVMSSDESRTTPFMLFAFISYNNYYGLGYDLDDIFKNSYGQLFLDQISMGKSFPELSPLFPTRLEDLFQDQFRTNFLNGRTYFNWLFKANSSLKHWIPRTPMQLYHGDADSIVPLENSYTAYNLLTALGSDVELNIIQGLDHEIAVVPFVLGTHEWWETFE